MPPLTFAPQLLPMPFETAHPTWFALGVGFMALLRVIIWPALLWVIAMYFKEALTYLIISVREFNIFGAKGELRNAYEVIDEKAQRKFEDKVAMEKREIELKDKEAKIEELSQKVSQSIGTAESQRLNAQESIKMAQGLLEENEKLKSKIDALENATQSAHKRLLRAFSALQQIPIYKNPRDLAFEEWERAQERMDDPGPDVEA